MPGGKNDDLFNACIKLIGRTGAREFRIRYCGEAKPIVWLAIGQWSGKWQATGGMNPVEAIMRLCEYVVDAGFCTHCHRPTGVTIEPDSMLLDKVVCWYQYDPSTRQFVRGCD